jgi:hypothetical protein
MFYKHKQRILTCATEISTHVRMYCSFPLARCSMMTNKEQKHGQRRAHTMSGYSFPLTTCSINTKSRNIFNADLTPCQNVAFLSPHVLTNRGPKRLQQSPHHKSGCNFPLAICSFLTNSGSKRMQRRSQKVIFSYVP